VRRYFLGGAGVILSDREILELIDNGMISPAERRLVGRDEGRMSFGPSPYGYDVRLGPEFAVYKKSDEPLDPRNVHPDDLEWSRHDSEFILPAKGFVLAVTIETITLPRDVTGLVHDKSSYARCGLNAMNTVLEGGWYGQVTLEIVNHLDRPVKLYVGQGIAQVLFFRGKPCRISYADRFGSYQGQMGVTLPSQAREKIA
jgi:dCTP deaminase